jgi:hypothetical protein
MQTGSAGTEQIQSFIQEEYKSLSSVPWTVAIPFDMMASCATATNEDITATTTLVDNILEYCQPMYKGLKIRFPLSYNDGDKGITALRCDLRKAALEHSGAQIVGTGTKNQGKAQANERRWDVKCNHALLYLGKKYNSNTSSVECHPECRETSLHNDRTNNRGPKGIQMVKRTSTQGRLDRTECHCPFLLPIFQDDTSYYLKGGLGCADHQYHIRLDSARDTQLPTALLSAEERELMSSARDASATTSVARNIHFIRSGSILTRSQVAHVFKTSGNKAYPDDETMSPADKLMHYLEKEGAGRCYLYHTKGSLELKENMPKKGKAGKLLPVLPPTGLVNEALNEANEAHSEAHSAPFYPSDVANEIMSTAIENQVVTLDPKEAEMQKEVVAFSEEHRNALKVSDDQDLMIGCAWLLPDEFRQFVLFPYVIHIDTTFDTNKEKRPLLTVSGRDSEGHMFTILRALLPNERGWVFRWIFQSVFPSLMGVLNLQRVCCFVTDGDSQETSQLDRAIAKFCPKAHRIRCAWHIIDRGWLKNCPGPRAAISENRNLYDTVSHTIKRWINSWAWPGYCETQDEFDLSKGLLLLYLDSVNVKMVFGEAGSTQIKSFIRNNVEPHEDFLCSFIHKSVFHLDTTSNTPHEGTNNGIKNCGGPALPQHTLDRSTEVLITQSKIKTAQTIVRLASKLSSKNLWSNLPTANFVTDLGEGLITAQWKERLHYTPRQVGQYKWLVRRTRSKEAAPSPTQSLIPKFDRVRVVERNALNRLECSCLHFSRVGIPCRHVLSVLSNVVDGYKGPSHHDVRTFWWRKYYYFGMSISKEHKKIFRLSLQLAQDDVTGPFCPDLAKPTELFHVDGEDFTVLRAPAGRRCMNYGEQHVEAAIKLITARKAAKERIAAHFSVPADMTQEIVPLVDVDSENEHDTWEPASSANHMPCHAPKIDFPVAPLQDLTNITTQAVDPYHHLNPIFQTLYQQAAPIQKELFSALGNRRSMAYLQVFMDRSQAAQQKLLQEYSDMVVDIRRLDSEETQTKKSAAVGRFVSALPQSNKRRKSKQTGYARK